MITVPCNMTEDEADYACNRYFREFRYYEELERAKKAFRPYLFYETWGRRNYRECFCQSCGGFVLEKGSGHDVYYDDPFAYHHGDAARCPMCGAEVKLICQGRMRNMNTLYQRRCVIFLRAEDGALAAEAGVCDREYEYSDLDPMPCFMPTRRYLFRAGLRQAWKRREIWEYDTYCTGHSVGHEWLPMKSVGEPFAESWAKGWGGEAFIVGAEEIGKSELRYSAAEEFFHDLTGQWLSEGEAGSGVRGLMTYLAEYTRRPQLEMLTKLGFTGVVARDLTNGLGRGAVNWKARSPAAFFRMDGRDFRFFRENDISMETAVAYHNRGETAREMDLREYAQESAFLDRSAAEFFTLCEGRGIRARRTAAYIREQAPIGQNGQETFTIWKDYLDMSDKLGRDPRAKRDIFPDDLRREHDAAAELLVRLAEDAEGKKYGKTRYRRLRRRYEWTDGELRIVVPLNAEDIRMEGKLLQHCVAGYASRHIEGKTTILFLRKNGEPEKRYVTIEVNDATGMIRQVHGFKNEADGAKTPMERHRAFFDGWLAWIAAGSPRDGRGRPVKTQTKDKQEEKTA